MNSTTRLKKQKGVALITTMLVVSLATILAVALVEHLHFDMRRTENILRLDQANLYNRAAVDVSRGLLALDLKESNKYDDLNDIDLFNTQMGAFPVEGGSISMSIKDLQSCFNLNNLSPTTAEPGRHRDAYIALLGALGIDTFQVNTLVDSLIDWLDEDDLSRNNGAEFDYYLGLEIPYRAANTLLSSISELRLINGYTEEVIESLEEHICVIPEINTGININTASQEMLESLNGLNGKGQQIVNDRDGSSDTLEDNAPFETLADFNKYIKDTLKIKSFNSEGLQVYSEYFLLRANTQLGDNSSLQYSVIYRNQGNAKTELISQARSTL